PVSLDCTLAIHTAPKVAVNLRPKELTLNGVPCLATPLAMERQGQINGALAFDLSLFEAELIRRTSETVGLKECKMNLFLLDRRSGKSTRIWVGALPLHQLPKATEA